MLNFLESVELLGLSIAARKVGVRLRLPDAELGLLWRPGRFRSSFQRMLYGYTPR